MTKTSIWRYRAGKLVAFLRGVPEEGIQIHPFPWSESGTPYFVVNPMFNVDGYGGYRANNCFDEHGVPFRVWGSRKVYNPLIVARYGLKMLALARVSGDPVLSEKAGAVLPFLVQSGLATGIWAESDNPLMMSGRSPSGLIQATVISTILRLRIGFPFPGTDEVLLQAAKPLLLRIEDGGVVSQIEGQPFLEEFPRSRPGHLLGGCMASLFGLYDLADGLGFKPGKTLADAVEKTLASLIGRFRGPLGWSRYALDVYRWKPLASAHYHRLHAVMLRVVALRTGNPHLLAVSREWERAGKKAAVRWTIGLLKTGQVLRMRSIDRIPLREG